MPLETSRGFTYRWMVGEREQGVTQALVEQELSPPSEDEEELEAEAEISSSGKKAGVAVVQRTVVRAH